MKKTNEYKQFLPVEAQQDNRLTDAQKDVLATLVYLSGKYSQQYKNNGKFYCSVRDLVRESNRSNPTVLKALNLLNYFGYIERNFDENQGTSTYTLRHLSNLDTKQIEDKTVKRLSQYNNLDTKLDTNLDIDIDKDLEVEIEKESRSSSSNINRSSSSSSNINNNKINSSSSSSNKEVEMENKITYAKDNFTITYFFETIEEAIQVIQKLQTNFGESDNNTTSTTTTTFLFENSNKENIEETNEEKLEETKENEKEDSNEVEENSFSTIPTITADEVEERASTTTTTTTTTPTLEKEEKEVVVENKVESNKTNDYKTTQEKVGKAITRLRTLVKEVKIVEKLEEDSDYHKALNSAKEWLKGIANNLTVNQANLLKKMVNELSEAIAAKTPKAAKPQKPVLDSFNAQEDFQCDPLTSLELVGLLTLQATKAVQANDYNQATEAYNLAMKAYKEATNGEKEDEVMQSKVKELEALTIQINAFNATNAATQFEQTAREAMVFAKQGMIKEANAKWIESNRIKYKYQLPDTDNLEKKVGEVIREASMAA